MGEVLQKERMKAILHVRIAPSIDFIQRGAFCLGLVLPWARAQAPKASLKQRNRKDTKMKLRLLLFLFLAVTMLAGSAMAQGCSVTTLPFPAPSSGVNFAYNTEFCIASGTPGGTQTGRLRWDNGGNGRLQLFDTDDTGQSLWCAVDTTTTRCAVGSSLCLQEDGNMVIYALANCNGSALWSSNTSNTNLGNPYCGFFLDDCNEDNEILGVFDNPNVGGITRTGERAVIYNDTQAGLSKQAIWFSSGFSD